MSSPSGPACECLNGCSSSLCAVVKYLGTDLRNGRFGDVELQQCQRCGRLWLHYHVEYEAYSKSGRWCHGLIDAETAEQVTAENAVATLARLEWYFFGGSYFEAVNLRGSGPLFVDLLGPPAYE